MHSESQASHSQGHPFHLVDPSPWPIVMAFSMLGLATGALLFMQDQPYGVWVLTAAAVFVLATAAVWWRDVIREGLEEHAHTTPVKMGLRFGMALFIVSEIMFFFAFFWAFFNASIVPKIPVEMGMWPSTEVGPWPPEGIETFNAWDIPLFNTLILLLSGTTVTWAHHALMHKDRQGLIIGLALTVILGVIFSGVQAFEYAHAAFGFSDGIYSSTFYMATGFHGAHVIIGTLFLLVNLIRAIRGTITPEGHLGFEFAAWYWHFVDVVWLFLFVWVYWWGGA